MSRGAGSAVAVTGVGGAVGLGVWTWFLAGRTLDVMDQWSSVVSSFAALLSLVLASVGLIVAVRGPAATPGAPGPGTGDRSFRARDAAGARVTLGDHSPIRDDKR